MSICRPREILCDLDNFMPKQKENGSENSSRVNRELARIMTEHEVQCDILTVLVQIRNELHKLNQPKRTSYQRRTT